MILRKFQFLVIAILVGGLMLSSCKKEEDNTSSPPAAPTVRDALHVYGNYFYVNWIGVTGAEKYFVDVATDQGFANILADYNNKEVAINGMFISYACAHPMPME